MAWFLAAIAAIAIIRVGIWPMRWLVSSDSDMAQGPLPWLLSRVAQDLGLLNGVGVWILGTVPGFGVLIVVSILLWQRCNSERGFRLVVVAIAASPFVMITFGMTRWAPDSLILLGMALFVLADRNSTAVVGILIAALTHPDQALASLVILSLVAWSRSWIVRSRILLGLLVGSTVFVGSYVVIVTNESMESSRLSANLLHSIPFVRNFIVDYAAAIFGTFGTVAVFLIWFFLMSDKSTKVRLTVACALALLLVLSTGDGTRVFAGVFSATYLFVIVTVANRTMSGKETSYPAGRRDSSADLDLGIAAFVLLLTAPVAWISSVPTLGGLPVAELLAFSSGE